LAKIIFYKQVREDGGVRTGIEINDLTYFEQYDHAEDEYDPALTWYVDVRCEGDNLPTDPDEARKWLLDQAPVIQGGLQALAEKLHAGIDVDSEPLHWQVSDAPPGSRIRIVCSAARRNVALEMGSFLEQIAMSWVPRIQTLPVAQAYSS
jgi:hypothetical protein